MELISSDSVVFSRVAASGSGEDATGAELGAGIGNLIGASGERRRENKFYEEALKAIRTDCTYCTFNSYAGRDWEIHPTSWTQSVQQQAASGDAKAQATLGRMYASGFVVSLDSEKAAIWWRKSADQGDADSQYALGGLYRAGLGVPQDYAEAYFWLDLAAAGNVSGLNSVDTARTRDEAASHLTPADLSREQERARKWFGDRPAKPE